VQLTAPKKSVTITKSKVKVAAVPVEKEQSASVDDILALMEANKKHT